MTVPNVLIYPVLTVIAVVIFIDVTPDPCIGLINPRMSLYVASRSKGLTTALNIERHTGSYARPRVQGKHCQRYS